MPYITQETREVFRKRAETGHHPLTFVPGELNYEFTLKIKKYLELNGTNYSTMNDVIGALEGAKLEFYRRVVAPYEDKKRELNDDVY